MDLVEACYKITASFPASERYGLASQMRRAAVSIPSNIAEGHCGRSTRPYLNHVSIALGSHGELRTCLEISDRLGYLTSGVKPPLFALSDSVGRLLYGLHHALEKRVQQSDQTP